MSFQTFEGACLPLKKAEIRIKTDLQMVTITGSWHCTNLVNSLLTILCRKRWL